jgi:hypothetical protein
MSHSVLDEIAAEEAEFDLEFGDLGGIDGGFDGDMPGEAMDTTEDTERAGTGPPLSEKNNANDDHRGHFDASEIPMPLDAHVERAKEVDVFGKGVVGGGGTVEITVEQELQQAEDERPQKMKVRKNRGARKPKSAQNNQNDWAANTKGQKRGRVDENEGGDGNSSTGKGVGNGKQQQSKRRRKNTNWKAWDFSKLEVFLIIFLLFSSPLFSFSLLSCPLVHLCILLLSCPVPSCPVLSFPFLSSLLLSPVPLSFHPLCRMVHSKEKISP